MSESLTKTNSDLQAGIWFGSVAPSPIITLSEHVRMINAAYISFIMLNNISGLGSVVQCLSGGGVINIFSCEAAPPYPLKVGFGDETSWA